MSFRLTKPTSLNQQLKKVQTHVLDENKSFILFVHADWCGYCRMMKPEWDKFTKDMNDKNKTPVSLIEIKDDVATEILKKQDDHLLKTLIQKTVSGYPTILLAIRDAEKNTLKIIIFDEERTTKGLHAFVDQYKKEIGGEKRERKGEKVVKSAKKESKESKKKGNNKGKK